MTGRVAILFILIGALLTGPFGCTAITTKDSKKPDDGKNGQIILTSYEGNKIPVCYLKNETDYELNVIVENLDHGTRVKPGEEGLLTIANIGRNPGTVNIKAIAFSNTGFKEFHLVGDTARQFRVPTKIPPFLPIWRLREADFH